MNILIIEDDKKIANYSKQGFEEENFTVDVVYNGEDGLEFLRKNSYDAIILDWMLPGIEGIEVCKKAREFGLTTPIIMLTAKVFLEDRVLGLNSGADDYVPKPFYFEELLARVNALMRRATYDNNPNIKIANLVIDIHKREVTRGGKLIELTPKEYSIFELLVQNRGKVVKLKTIIKQLWENENDISSNIINVYMHHLRHKIDSNYKVKLIKTVRKLGYRIDS
ncbi:MAG: response regulator transcription factor [Epsilonproteobacteria bacterium]|nr:response regulator transcription factor [Campylobacterota bacterium]